MMLPDTERDARATWAMKNSPPRPPSSAVPVHVDGRPPIGRQNLENSRVDVVLFLLGKLSWMGRCGKELRKKGRLLIKLEKMESSHYI
ncbi:hypothetical protein JTE90_021258 [Oedothorax gibbosus]|uniref:Uncharacterized protein n=1 Tax=Oedothorax gibbosus TaxID=931172 RepID=A0AAV6TDB3_9ARAC|nr:hypothetical protein JTE90_021258 [Oedothorax gibbosus]